MRIHRIRLRNYRGVTESEVVFADRGVTIVEGDNEVGKSSLAQAVRLVLDYRDDSNHRAVKAVQPVGRDLGAEVEVEISSGPYRFVYAKRWHRQRQTTLQLLEPRREQLAGREAHERVEAILAETLDRDLWQALSVEQGAALSQAGFDLEPLSRALDRAAGGSDLDAPGDDLWERVCAERNRYWTPGGQPNRERVRSGEDVSDVRQRVAGLDARLVEIEADAEEMSRLAGEAARLQRVQVDFENTEAELTLRSGTVAELRARVRQLCSEDDAARSEHDSALVRVERRREQLAAEQEAAEVLAARLAELEQSQPARASAQARHGAAQQALCAARAARSAAEARFGTAVSDRDHRRQEIELAQLTERRDRVVAAQLRLVEAERELEAIRVDDELVVRIELAHLELEKARAAVESGSASVRATALRDLAVVIDGQRKELAAEAVTERSIHTPFELTVPGLLRVQVRPGVEAQGLAERLREAGEELAVLCAAGGVHSLDEARALAARRAEALRTRAAAGATVTQDLRDLTLEALTQKIERLTARVAAYVPRRVSELPLPTDFDTAQAQANAAEAALAECQAELERRERDAEHAATAVQDAAVGSAGLEALVGQARSALSQSQRVLAAARLEQPDEHLDAGLSMAAVRLAGTSAALSDAETRLAAEDPDGLEELLANARAAKARGLAALHDNSERQQGLRVKLDLLGELGLGEELDQAKTRLEQLERDQRSLEARAAAARLLHDTFAARRAEAHARYVAPFRRKIEQFGRLVFGDSFEVELDAQLRVARRTLAGVTVDFEQLSTGAQEQLGIISRLACAAIVSADGGAPVILDDALGWTDPGRLELMGAALAVAGRESQVIIFTCSPGRYSNVGSATVIRLPRRAAQPTGSVGSSSTSGPVEPPAEVR